MRYTVHHLVFFLVLMVVLSAFWWDDREKASKKSSGVIQTNQVVMHNPPAWLTESRVQKVIDEVGNFLEWDIRRIHVYCYQDEAKFKKVHGFGSWARAIARKRDQSIHLGPKVTDKNFNGIFGHELAHVVVFQKYNQKHKRAIPPWLEEGLANYAARHGTVNYKYLASKPKREVTKLAHPIRGDPRYHYNASTALMEMFADKCSINDLLQLSVGKKLETYLKNYCEIKDINAAFHKWIQQKATGKKKKRYWWEK